MLPGGNLSLLPGGNKVCYLGKKKFVTGIKLSLLPGERGGQSVFIQHLHSSSQEKSVLQELKKENIFLDQIILKKLYLGAVPLHN